MKNVIAALLVTALVSFSNQEVQAADGPGLKEIIIQLIGSPVVDDVGFEEALVNIEFMINFKREVVVLSTDSPRFDTFVKERLNYHKVDSDDVVINQNYTLPLVIQKD